MNDLIQLPTVEQINIEHQLANNKASEAVQHATNCGLMLLQVKASLNHGEWLPWLNGEIESGRLMIASAQAHRYMRLAKSNLSRGINLEEAPSIRAALELLSDKEPEAEAQGTLIDVEAERQAREAAEAKAETERQARELFERRAQESQAESNERRNKIRDLETEIDKLKEQSIEIKEIEKIHDDYEETKNKERNANLEKQTEEIRNNAPDLVDRFIKGHIDFDDAMRIIVEREATARAQRDANLDSFYKFSEIVSGYTNEKCAMQLQKLLIDNQEYYRDRWRRSIRDSINNVVAFLNNREALLKAFSEILK